MKERSNGLALMEDERGKRVDAESTVRSMKKRNFDLQCGLLIMQDFAMNRTDRYHSWLDCRWVKRGGRC